MELPKTKSQELTLLLLSLLIISCHAYPTANDEPDFTSTSSPQCNKDPLAITNNNLGFQLTQQIGGTDNLFISPLSIYVALGMTYLGAGGKTAEQLEGAFGLKSQNLTSAQLQESFRQLLTSISSGNDQYSLLVANGLFVQQNYTINSDYIDAIRQIYQALVQKVNFATNGNQAVVDINKWVADITQNKIEKLLNSPLDPTTRLVLLNAVYFKGTWKVQFPKMRTASGTFYSTKSGRKDVEMMSLREETFRFYEDASTNYKFIELPYKGEHIVMLLALPKQYDSPADLIMTSDILCRVNSSMTPTELEDVIIPKFKLEHEVELNDALKGLGVNDLFVAGSANLTGIRNANDLFVSSVLHKAVIEVNEEGSEAAAVSGVMIQMMSISFKPHFVANHPFLFYIMDNRNGLVLFSGRVSDP